jgi:hypothetical protein
MLRLLLTMLLFRVLAQALRLVVWMAIALMAVGAFGGPLFGLSPERWLWMMLRGFN